MISNSCKNLVIPVCLTLLLLSCSEFTTQKLYRNGVVVTSSPIASDIGRDILVQGGNAIDAACAAAFAMSVCYPKAGNIGGGGFALLYMADSQKVYSIDFRETAPIQTDLSVYLDSTGALTGESLVGPAASGTPGTVGGLAEMHRRFGRLPFAELVAPARIMADSGITLDEHLVESLNQYREELSQFESSRRVFFQGDIPLHVGERLYQPDLAATLRLIEDEGAPGFYTGVVAENIASYCAAHGGFITVDDLASYEPLWRAPVTFSWDGLDIYTMGLPSSGGVVMGEIFEMLSRFELGRYSPGHSEYIHLFAEAARRAYADRSEYLGDPAYAEDLTDALLDPGYIDSRARTIDPDHASSSESIQPGIPAQVKESDQTTHLVAVDREGNIVSLTYTLNLSYGCKAVVEGSGFLLNNEMDDFAIAHGIPNAYGLIGGDANRIEPGKRMLSSMSPTIVLKQGKPLLALGSPGGSRIITTVAQTIIDYYLYGLPLAEAVNHPRFHHQWLPDQLFLEQGGYDINTIQALIKLGHNVEERSPFGEVTALEISVDDMHYSGVADRRGYGKASGY